MQIANLKKWHLPCLGFPRCWGGDHWSIKIKHLIDNAISCHHYLERTSHDHPTPADSACHTVMPIVTSPWLLKMAPHRACLLGIPESQKMWTCHDPSPFPWALWRGSTALVQERPPPGDRVNNDELGSIDEGLYHGVTFTSVMSYILEQMWSFSVAGSSSPWHITRKRKVPTQSSLSRKRMKNSTREADGLWKGVWTWCGKFNHSELSVYDHFLMHLKGCLCGKSPYASH